MAATGGAGGAGSGGKGAAAGGGAALVPLDQLKAQRRDVGYGLRGENVEDPIACDNWWKLCPKCCACYPNCFPAKQLRHAVSQKKMRYTSTRTADGGEGFDLDLVYLTDKIVCFGYPAIGLEHMYRNPRAECQRFFEERHAGHYRIYNLCCETGRAYAADVFDGRVERYPFADHGVPTLELMLQCCLSAARHIEADDENVVGIHCKAGKGRTGLLTCCLLIHLGVAKDAKEAIDIYNSRRVRNYKGLTVPSQRRYVKYYETVLEYYKRGSRLPEPTRRLLRVTYSHPEHGKGFVKVFRGNDASVLATTTPLGAGTFEFSDGGQPGVDVTGDTFVGLYKKDGKIKYDVWFNTGFAGRNGDPADKIVILKLGIDKLKKDFDNKKAPADLTVTFEFAPLPDAVKDLTAPEFAGAPAALAMIPHVHTKYCDRKFSVCTAEKSYREGESLKVCLAEPSNVTDVAWYKSDPGVSLGEAAKEGDLGGSHGASEAKAGEADGLLGAAALPASPAGAPPGDGEFPPEELVDKDSGVVFRRVPDKKTACPSAPPPPVDASPEVLSSSAAVQKFVRQQQAHARANPLVYLMQADDDGRYFKALVRIEGQDSPIATAPVGPCEAGPPKVREIVVTGEMKVGSPLRAAATYFGGRQGATEFWWMRITPEGTRVEITEPRAPAEPDSDVTDADLGDPRVYVPVADDVNCSLKAMCIAVRGDGTRGQKESSKPTPKIQPDVSPSTEEKVEESAPAGGGAESGGDAGDGSSGGAKEEASKEEAGDDDDEADDAADAPAAEPEAETNAE